MRVQATLESPLFPMLFLFTLVMSSCTGGQDNSEVDPEIRTGC